MVSTVRWSCIGRVTPTLASGAFNRMNRSAKWMPLNRATLSTVMPTVMDERHEQIHSESISSDKRKWSLRLTAVNITNKYALYNFLSTFSGTHYLTPRALNAELGFHF